MKRTLFIIFICIMSVYATGALCQERNIKDSKVLNQIDSDSVYAKAIIQGREILSKVADAFGGVTKLKIIKSIKSESKITAKTPYGPKTAEVLTLEVFPDKFAQTIKTPQGDQSIVFNGTEGWSTSFGNTTPMSPKDNEDQQKTLLRNTILILASADNLDLEVFYKGIEKFNDRKVQRLDFLKSGKLIVTWYIDSTTYLLVGRKYKGSGKLQDSDIIDVILEYKDFNGYIMCAKETSTNGNMEFRHEVLNIQINGDYDESIFKRPSDY